MTIIPMRIPSTVLEHPIMSLYIKITYKSHPYCVNLHVVPHIQLGTLVPHMLMTNNFNPSPLCASGHMILLEGPAGCLQTAWPSHRHLWLTRATDRLS
jgi:hypothetical protein